MSPANSLFALLPAPGPHPAAAELRAYAAGALSPAEQQRIEAHTLDCERCADLVDGFSMTDAATTDQAVAVLRARLQARVEIAEPQPGPTGWAWPRVAAAAALLGVVAGGIWGWERHDPSVAPATARLEASQPVAPAAPLPASAPVPAPPSAPDAAVATAPEPPKSPEYAAVAPVPSRPLHTRRRGNITLADRIVTLNKGAALADNAVSAEPALDSKETEAALEQPVLSSSQNATSVATTPPAQREDDGVAEKVVAKDTGAFQGAIAASRSMKAKARSGPTSAADNAAPGRVAATPMPAAPSIAPAPVGGSGALRDYLRREAAAFEPESTTPRMSGTVRIRFVVGPNGQLSDLKVTRGLHADYNAEALRIVCDGPAWQPGIASGRRTALPMEVTVPFYK